MEEGECIFYGFWEYHKTWVLVCVWDWVKGKQVFVGSFQYG